jgi:transposase
MHCQAMGVGPIAALNFKSAVDDPTRFKRSRSVGAYFGLTPRRYQSGEHDNPGRISKTGDRDVRAVLYAAANALLMRTMASSQIKSCTARQAMLASLRGGMRLMRTKGRRRAVVAVARKLAILMHRMWIDGSDVQRQPPWPVATTNLSGGSDWRTGLPVWRSGSPDKDLFLV